MKDFITLLKAEFKFAFTLEQLFLSGMTIAIAVVTTVGIIAQPGATISLGAPVALLAILMYRLQMVVGADYANVDKLRVAYVQFDAKKVFLVKLLLEIILNIAIMFILGAIYVVIAITKSEDNILIDSLFLILKIFLIGFAIYPLMVVSSWFFMSFVKSANVKRGIAGGVGVVWMALLIIWPFLMVYIPSFAELIMNIELGIWFVPVFNLMLITLEGTSHMYLSFIPVIYTAIIIFAIWNVTSKRIKKGVSQQ